jgi:hypothetical protein
VALSVADQLEELPPLVGPPSTNSAETGASADVADLAKFDDVD